MITPPPLVILGFGYTGRWLYRLAHEQSGRILASSRQPERHLTEVPPTDRIRFDVTDPTSWPTLPREADLIWTFPAIPLDQVQEFAKQHCHAHRRLVVLGSTSAYDRHEQPTMDLPP
ncbi:MAG TPA: hypothetical protein PLZ20_06325, partial [Nitrospira sp.]|nr:hypothetical protein [Nitrospira sp.]